MSWIWSALMPHPPIIVPGVGGGREREAAGTLEGVDRLMKRVVDQKPDVLLLLSPHQPYAPGALFLNAAPHPKGSLALFGVPRPLLELSTPLERLPGFVKHLTGMGTKVREGADRPDLTRDQGALVPLYFLSRAWGEELPPVVLASPIGLDIEGALKLGEALASFEDGAKWALLASGDLSHRLTPDAPSGYSPAGKKFDRAVVDSLSSFSPRPLFDLSPDELEDAGECGMRSVLAMLGLCGKLEKSGTITVFSYEGPFGVGYCNALWTA
ncbi:MAG: hypothetical protein LBR61_11380 [Synergistaceae bacterium]|jgi:aromatic ring-opening dioxygenase LigB subunit|nr:hypothetical protein [Synergistaceae bacterium]